MLTEVHCVHLFNAVFELEGLACILLCALLALLPYGICLSSFVLQSLIKQAFLVANRSNLSS